MNCPRCGWPMDDGGMIGTARPITATCKNPSCNHFVSFSAEEEVKPDPWGINPKFHAIFQNHHIRLDFEKRVAVIDMNRYDANVLSITVDENGNATILGANHEVVVSLNSTAHSIIDEVKKFLGVH